MTSAAALDAARRIADAVLYEGYVLFPYRASAPKNRYRWQWGVLIPTQQADLGWPEPSEVSFAVPLRHRGAATLRAAARFLVLRRRQVRDADGASVERVEAADGELLITWDEGMEREVDSGRVPVTDLHASDRSWSVVLEGDEDVEDRGSATVERTIQPLEVRLRIGSDRVDDDVAQLTVHLANVTDWAATDTDRDEVLRRSLVGAHVVLSVDGGTFGSVIDPPDWASGFNGTSRGLYPVLVSADDDVLLASPIILDDHPQVAAESPGPSFDGLEIDELLTLAVRAMTDEEKREARATDPLAAEVIDRSVSLPPAALERLHGTIREFGPGAGLQPEPEAGVDPETVAFFGVGEEPLEHIEIDGRAVEVGDSVVLRPRRRADAHDLFAAGQHATVERIVRTVDGETMLAVTLRDDPAADLHRWYGRFQYFHVDEVAPTGGDAGAEAPEEVGT